MAGFGDNSRRVFAVAQSATSKATAVGQTALMLTAGHDAQTVAPESKLRLREQRRRNPPTSKSSPAISGAHGPARSTGALRTRAAKRSGRLAGSIAGCFVTGLGLVLRPLDMLLGFG